MGQEVFLWNEHNSQIALLDARNSAKVCSVAWMDGGRYIAVGCSRNLIKVYDVEMEKAVMTLKGHSGKVNSLSWTKSVLASGDVNGRII